jgi:hypothetical protein
MLTRCRARREGDEFACSCGKRWAADDSDPPACAGTPAEIALAVCREVLARPRTGIVQKNHEERRRLMPNIAGVNDIVTDTPINIYPPPKAVEPLTFDQIEDAFPESNPLVNGEINAQWLHEFAQEIHRRYAQAASPL